ncbi:hypothetical protein OSB04_013629 [Centaurea solstitialis]|uniref:Uncharacterized protein n=1 Tax=Centaurea solstitialis TaxID=347529 RepID=A0AA38TQC0_9ASTR|nr:hypothetical protein OSB04_013629 [Centaurea solstitialis]
MAKAVAPMPMMEISRGVKKEFVERVCEVDDDISSIAIDACHAYRGAGFSGHGGFCNAIDGIEDSILLKQQNYAKILEDDIVTGTPSTVEWIEASGSPSATIKPSGTPWYTAVATFGCKGTKVGGSLLKMVCSKPGSSRVQLDCRIPEVDEQANGATRWSNLIMKKISIFIGRVVKERIPIHLVLDSS